MYLLGIRFKLTSWQCQIDKPSLEKLDCCLLANVWEHLPPSVLNTDQHILNSSPDGELPTAPRNVVLGAQA